MNNDRIVVLDGARTPIGSFGGAFKDIPGHERRDRRHGCPRACRR